MFSIRSLQSQQPKTGDLEVLTCSRELLYESVVGKTCNAKLMAEEGNFQPLF